MSKSKIELLREARKNNLEKLSKQELIKRIMDATLFTETILLIKNEGLPFDVDGLLATLESTQNALDK